jgi:uncharacterized protein (DUF433 family)
MNLPNFLTTTPDGEILLTGNRIGLFHVVHYYNEGYSPEMLVCQYPTLPLSLIHKVIAFYLENRSEVDAYVAGCQTEMNRQRESGDRHLDLALLRERLGSRQKIETTSDS